MRELCLEVTADPLFPILRNATKGARTVPLLKWPTMVLFQPQVGSTNALYSSLPCPPHPTLAGNIEWTKTILRFWNTGQLRTLTFYWGHVWVWVGIAFSGNKEWPVSHLQLWLYPGVLKFHFISPKGIPWDFLSLRSITLVAIIEQFDVQQADIVEWQPSYTNWEMPMGGSHIGSLGRWHVEGAYECRIEEQKTQAIKQFHQHWSKSWPPFFAHWCVHAMCEEAVWKWYGLRTLPLCSLISTHFVNLKVLVLPQ